MVAIAEIRKLPDVEFEGGPSANRGLYINGVMVAQVSGPMGAHCLSAILDRMLQGPTTLDSFKKAAFEGNSLEIPDYK